jgi:hypothetical protein
MKKIIFLISIFTLSLNAQNVATIKSPNGCSSATAPNFAKMVYVNALTPATATIFDLANPPTTNDNSLKSDVNNIYVGTDGKTYTYNSATSTYNTYVNPIKSSVKARWSAITPLAANTSIVVANLTQTQINTTPSQWNATTGTYTAQKTGIYMVTASVSALASVSVGSYLNVSVRKNGVNENSFLDQSSGTASSVYLTANGSVPMLLNVGDRINFEIYANVASNSHIMATYFSVTEQ